MPISNHIYKKHVMDDTKWREAINQMNRPVNQPIDTNRFVGNPPAWGTSPDLTALTALVQTVMETQHQILVELKALTQEKEFYRIRCEELEKLLDGVAKV